MTAVFGATAGLYALASIFFFAFLFVHSDGLLRLARWSLAAALLAHLTMIGLFCQAQLNPLRDLRGALSLSAGLLGAGFLLTARNPRLGVIGAFTSPLALVLLITSRLTPHDLPAWGKESATRLLGELHIALSAFGVAAFGLAAAVAVVYLVQEAALKNKRVGALYRRGPALTTLDELGRRLTLAGFPVFTLAVITGLVWVSRLARQGSLRLEYAISGATWIIFAALIVLRLTVGMRGRRAALLTVLGFTATISVLLMYMLRRVALA